MLFRNFMSCELNLFCTNFQHDFKFQTPNLGLQNLTDMLTIGTNIMIFPSHDLVLLTKRVN